MKLSHISLAVLSAIALAACGGSGSSNQVIPGDGGKDKDKEKETTPVAAADLNVKSNYTTAFAAGTAKSFKVDGKTDKKVVQFGTSADDNQGMVPNSKLLNDAGKTTFAGDAETVVANVYTKTKDGKFVAVKKIADDESAVYADGDGKKTPLKADQLYQYAGDAISGTNDTGSYLTGVEAFGSTAAVTNRDSLPTKVSMNKLPAGMSEGDIKYTYTSQVKQFGSDAATALEDADGNARYLSAAHEDKIGSYKAYKQNLTAVALTTDTAGDLSALNLSSTGYEEATAGLLVSAGKQTLDLPESVKAEYTGKAFTLASNGDLTLNVEFGKRNNARMEGKIARTDVVSKKKLEEYTIPSKDVNGSQFTLAVKGEDGADASEYTTMTGAFYGSNAEEVAGTLTGTADSEGVFAASKK